MKKHVMCGVVLVAWIPISSALADTIHVPADVPTIQEAIDAASDGDEVIVAPGTYPEAIDFLGKAITVRSSDGPDVTTIDATGLDRSVVTFATGEGRDSVMEGFTVTGGTGTVFGEYDWLHGGGVFVRRASPTIRNNNLTGNFTFMGSGLASVDGSHPLVEACAFVDNEAEYAVGGLASLDGDITVRDCSFIRNEAPDGPGGMYVTRGSADISDCTFLENRNGTYFGGGLLISSMTGPCTVARSMFERNWALDGGAGLWATGNRDVVPAAIDCVFRDNESRAYGAGLLNSHGLLNVIGCTFERNYADHVGAGCSSNRASTTISDSLFIGNNARVNGGAISAHHNSSTVVVNSVFVGNTSGFWGGAVFNDTGAHEIISSTFVDNTTQISGSGIYVRSSDSMVHNSIVRGSSPMQVSQDISDLVVRYSNVEGGFDGEGNIDAMPLFVRDPSPGEDGEWGTEDDDYGDLRLLADSAGIDAGDNDVVPPSLTLDPSGGQRFVDDPSIENTGNGRCPIIDIGAYEYQTEGGCCPGAPRWICDGDIDGDAQVNPVDAGLVQGAFGSGEEEDLCRFDLDCDGQINPVDAGIVQSLFGTCDPPRDVCP